jgi:hypothetical protein
MARSHFSDVIHARSPFAIGASKAREAPAVNTPLDFSHVTSNAMVGRLFAQGKLQKLLLLPAEFGGEDVPQNVVYVPPGILPVKDELTGTLVRFAKEGLINKLQVVPEYRGDSFVPCKIRIKAWHSDKQGGFEPSIDVW